VDRPPREEKARVIERREESYAESTVGHCIKYAVTGDCRKQKQPELESADARNVAAECEENSPRKQCSKYQSVGESAVPPEISVADPKSEPNRIQVRDSRANGSQGPHALRDTALVKAGANRQARNRV
jgi:hypothetical protein